MPCHALRQKKEFCFPPLFRLGFLFVGRLLQTFQKEDEEAWERLKESLFPLSCYKNLKPLFPFRFAGKEFALHTLQQADLSDLMRLYS